MGLFVVAIQLKYNSYNMFRVVDSNTGQVKDLHVLELRRSMIYGKHRIKLENLRIDYERDSFKFIGCDDSRICYLDEQLKPKVNEDGMLILGIDGDYVYLANYKGQIARVHMLTVRGNAKKGKCTLINAYFLENGRIVLKEQV